MFSGEFCGQEVSAANIGVAAMSSVQVSSAFSGQCIYDTILKCYLEIKIIFNTQGSGIA